MKCSFLLPVSKGSFATSWRKVQKEWRKQLKDIFCDMQAKIGCLFISDLPEYKRAVWFEMRRMTLEDYPQEQLEDFSRYVFGVPYTVIQEALTRKEVMKHGRNACTD